MVTRATSFVQLLRRWLINPVIDFLYPPACLVCGVRVDGTPDFICPSCLSALTRLDDDHPVAREIRGRLREERVELVASVFLMEHGGGLQTLIHEMKYRGMKNVGVWFGELIGWRLTELPSRRRIDGIIPVPLHTVRKRERGFNQSDLISRGSPASQASLCSLMSFAGAATRIRRRSCASTVARKTSPKPSKCEGRRGQG